MNTNQANEVMSYRWSEVGRLKKHWEGEEQMKEMQCRGGGTQVKGKKAKDSTKT